MTNTAEPKVISALEQPTYGRGDEARAPLPRRSPGVAGHRVQVIATIHAYADFLADNPDIPIPDAVSGRVYGADLSASEASARLARFATRESLKTKSGGGSRWAELVVATRGTHGVDIEHTVFG